MSFWSSQSLRERLPSLIRPFNQNRIESSSYQLSLGGEVYISPLPDTPSKERRKEFLKEGSIVPIPPGQFAFLITLEEISVPPNAIAFISIKFGAKAKGLINVSGFHVDPGYEGRLIFAVYNAGPLNFQVGYGEKLFSIWFADLDKEDDSPRKKQGFNSITTDVINGPDLVSSLPYLVKRINETEKKLERYSTVQAILWGFVAAIILAIGKPLIDQILSFWTNN